VPGPRTSSNVPRRKVDIVIVIIDGNSEKKRWAGGQNKKVLVTNDGCVGKGKAPRSE